MEYDIRGGQGISPFVSIGEKYGDQLVKGIVQAGANIEQGLQRVQTNRELQGLNQTLSQIDPKTPDYPQKLLMLKGQFPLAAYDPRGLASVSMGFKAHMDWQNGQQALQQAAGGLEKSKALVDYRASKRPPGQDGVDLNPMFEGAPVPDQLAPQNPATGAGFAPEAPLGDGGLAQEGGVYEGANSVLPPQDFQPVGKPTTPGGAPVDPLMERALKPLRDTQVATGVKPTKSQVFGAVASERTRVQQQAMQDDRQAQQDKRDAEKLAKDEAVLASKQSVAAKEKAFSNAKSILENKTRRLTTLLGKEKAALEDIVRDDASVPPQKRDLSIDKEHMEQTAKIQRMQKELDEAEEKLGALLDKADALGGKDAAETVYATEEEALAAGKLAGDIVTIINPKTGKPAKARLE